MLILTAISGQLSAETIDDKLQTIISAQSLTGDPAQAFNLPLPDEPEAELGKLLFFSQALGGEQNAACASCHHPYLAGGDGLALAVGVDAENPLVMGDGRKHPDGIFNNPRNTPSIMNAWIWTQGLFLDSRVEKLASGGIRTPDSAFGEADAAAGESLLIAQAGFPVTSVEEMRTENFETGQSNETVRHHLGQRLANEGIGANELDKNEWRTLFEGVYGSETPEGEEVVNFDNVKRAIASYESSLNLTNNRWFSYIKGDIDAITEQEKRGAKLFYSPAPEGAGCVGCHSGDTFTSQAFFNVGFPQIGPGKGHGASGVDDFGRGAESSIPADNNAFRISSLLNVGVTAPYGHAGAYQTLEQVVDHYNDFDVSLPAFVTNKNWCEHPQFIDVENCESLFPEAETFASSSVATMQFLRTLGIPAMLPLGLTTEGKADLVAFLHTLTDPCTQDAVCMSKWLPNPQQNDPDGLQLHAINKKGLPLSMTRECDQVSLESGALALDQMECISGNHKSFYFHVKEDDTNLVISTTGGSGNADIFYNANTWATPFNAQAMAIKAGNEEVVYVKANRGYRYISVGSENGYQLTGLTVSIEAEPTPPPGPDVADACTMMFPVQRSGELKPGESVCVGQGIGYFTAYIDENTASVTVRTEHGTGNLSLYTGRTWPNANNNEGRSTNSDSNSEAIIITNPPVGWLYITVEGENANGMSIRLDKTSH